MVYFMFYSYGCVYWYFFSLTMMLSDIHQMGTWDVRCTLCPRVIVLLTGVS